MATDKKQLKLRLHLQQKNKLSNIANTMGISCNQLCVKILYDYLDNGGKTKGDIIDEKIKIEAQKIRDELLGRLNQDRM